MTEEEKKILEQFNTDPLIRNDEVINQICSYFRNIPQAFMEKWADKLDWKKLCQTQHLKNKFMDRMCDYVDFKIISCTQRLTEWFIEKWKKELDWFLVSRCQEMSKDFIIEHLEYIDVFALMENRKCKKYGEEFYRTLLKAKPNSRHYLINLNYIDNKFTIDFVREFKVHFNSIPGKLINSRERKDWKEFNIKHWSL